MAAGLAVLAATAGGGLGSPAVAQGETPPGQVEFPTHCLPPQEAGLPPADGTTTARITVGDPAPRVGDTVTVTYQVATTPAVNPVGGELPADALTPTGRVLLGGAQSGEVTVVGAKRNDPVEAGAALPGVTMTGTFTVTAPGEVTLAPGGYTLHTSHPLDLDTVCTATGTPVSERLTASPLPTANLRGVSLAAAYGKPGARVKVTGAGFAPGASVTVAGRAGAAETPDRVAAKADDRGAFEAELPVSDKATTAVVAYEGTAWSAGRGSGPAAYTVIDAVPPPPGTQKVTAVVEPGALSMSQAGESVVLGAVPYGDGGAAPGRIGTVTVKDARGGPAGWTLTGKVTDFTGPGGVRIPGASLSWTPSCVAAEGSPSRCVAGSAGVVGPEGAVLASAPDAGAVGGTFTIDATVTLRVPPYTPPDAYQAVLTLTLS
ncbi:WxL domain-containing protein [Streptomyces sp. NBC_01551]|uniref:WxL domain-containing protein n=1 Tax=Streptomyces sp. NBC_01551 TaxID=2975876 RepID=UPI00225166F5|nr:WxL domain-containing protein [Streptomyces sp. NBC_01551]MCX4525792.1 WxL domain-containing protein [Streptomyces sp. NBC_01551]